ncbi:MULTISPECIES: adenylyltransferase/cytidyltransferase family protein [unclassified Pseudomonas]|uniref:adenylyltransferase/cytidyltransferase family protein n=1 Tax=unclassified Pseudomonas TaxID=196821 RepID=UPI001198F121|nr:MULTISPECIES: adenylyltransferase/cytidyltransferase family protein [unclassified Pseudomonas]TWC10689.1 nicotinate-nucleotide adenylyltransferase [Pseudomonas sp. SJZ075]TWC15414.1 nicotinate-nucleotide adenylyltransferase [Pseudomonas sp. SJZ074]TWC26893.1 nicotinate-nucleotide adenylyltransferase [Pseudomonas sp. SJZ078]TWC33646.1 nicotinate-nucleotide adenylyltransferase [Pseudomonas sp. SJZ085]TWC46302.1 nicotinate-nucleotide adenylyltransferase [Pseudomonas sp. SJZ124]
MFELALYGGAFNPPHAGHAQVMIQASFQARRVLVAPSFRHPYGKRMVDYEVRLKWLEAIVERVQPLCDAQVHASRVEQVVARDVEGPIYSYTLLAHLADSLALDGKRIALAVGQDVADLLPTFYRGEELLERFSILCMEETIHVRSTLVRERLALGKPLPSDWMAPGLNPLNYDLYATHGNRHAN